MDLDDSLTIIRYRLVIILGLHFGHDASVAVIRDGRIASFVSRERRSGLKHAAGLGIAEIRNALSAAGIDVDDVHFCTVTSTQHMELICPGDDDMALEYGPRAEHPVPSPLLESFARRGIGLQNVLQSGYVLSIVSGENDATPANRTYCQSLIADWINKGRSSLKSFPTIDVFAAGDCWNERAGFDDIRHMQLPASVDGLDELRRSFHFPVSMRLCDRNIPGYFVHHHMAHAASVYYASRCRNAAIITHDGYPMVHTYNGGFFYVGVDERIYPLSPNYLSLGHLYSSISIKLGLGNHFTGPGKLMGLSSYGTPRFFDQKFVGNDFDLKRRFERPITTDETDTWMVWWSHCLNLATRYRYDLSALSRTNRITEPVNADIAASTQKLFEEVYLSSADVINHQVQRLAQPANNLCLSGGTALNCLNNSRLLNESAFDHVFVEPCCDDSGLSIGGALHLFHNLLGHPLANEQTTPYFNPYVGRHPTKESIASVLGSFGRCITAELLDPNSFAQRAAEELAEDQIVALFVGSSEIGPRALCHRSILAHPGKTENWQRVNRIKGREIWRPLAPVVLADRAKEWFCGAPDPSPYMLFTATVVSNELPAVTHVDRSSRIQTADTFTGPIYEILRHFLRLTGLPVLMNTSFNGPGEPIVEEPRRAIEFLLQTELDALYIEGWRVSRSTSH